MNGACWEYLRDVEAGCNTEVSCSVEGEGHIHFLHDPSHLNMFVLVLRHAPPPISLNSLNFRSLREMVRQCNPPTIHGHRIIAHARRDVSQNHTTCRYGGVPSTVKPTKCLEEFFSLWLAQQATLQSRLLCHHDLLTDGTAEVSAYSGREYEASSEQKVPPRALWPGLGTPIAHIS